MDRQLYEYVDQEKLAVTAIVKQAPNSLDWLGNRG